MEHIVPKETGSFSMQEGMSLHLDPSIARNEISFMLPGSMLLTG